jgi:carbon monoxide dehydrogenase subunit G
VKVAGEHVFAAGPQDVWDGLLDPEVLAATMPGCDKLELVGENQYEGILNIKVGPVQGKFKGRIELEDIQPPSGYSMKVDGQGAPGFVKATAKILLAQDGSGTRMTYDGDAQVGGRIASVGQRLLESSAKAIIKQSLEGLDTTLSARAAGGDEAEAPIEAPSQAEFARSVAKEVAKDIVPKPVLYAIVAILVLLILFFLLR